MVFLQFFLEFDKWTQRISYTLEREVYSGQYFKAIKFSFTLTLYVLQCVPT